MKKFEMRVERTKDGYTAYNAEEGAYTTGDTFQELKDNMVKVLNLSLMDLGRTITFEDIQVAYDVPSFFETYKIINAKALAARVGMTQSMLSQYTSGTKKAGPKQAQRILEGVRDLGRELAAMDFAF